MFRRLETSIGNGVLCYFRRSHVWTKGNVVVSPFRDVSIPEVTLPEYVWNKLIKWSDKIAVQCGVTERKYTYAQLYKHSQILGAHLRKNFGLKDGDTVAIMMPNLPEYPTTIFGILSAGGVVTTLNPIYTPYEVQRQIQLSEAKLIITVPEIVPVVKEALEMNKKSIPIIVNDVFSKRPEGTVSYKEIIDNTNIDTSILKEVKRKFDDVAFLPYSSGTTGLPKGVELTHYNIVTNCEQQNNECQLHNDTTESNQDSTLAILPMFHSYGLGVVTLHKLSVGTKLVTLPKFKPDTFVEALAKHKMEMFFLAPPLLLFLATYPQVKAKHLERVRSVIIGAAPVPKVDVETFLRKIDRDCHVAQGYGLTETSPLATISPIGFKNYTSVGFPLSNTQLRVVDENLKNMGPNEVGELLIKGPHVMKGYKDNPEANSQVFVEDKWFRSGDLARIAEDGSVSISDRLKELIKVNAYQVPPAELEGVLKEHPDIFDAAVVPVPDPATGEKPKAFVVLYENKYVTETNILEFVSKRVAPYKRIKEVVFLKEIPKNPSGKILRRVLIEKYC
ncbi:4-coumarate--CoA ligase 2-like [Zerene cesonia]|uniref:4-coumarate--CoA ligase 2-like n=1 Tax=Zerene cesonia TaxID=33412 RepID=UPI0018E542C8|nr:4-coumarate--CoA ligase 2-like [Zerene cesonia]